MMRYRNPRMQDLPGHPGFSFGYVPGTDGDVRVEGPPGEWYRALDALEVGSVDRVSMVASGTDSDDGETTFHWAVFRRDDLAVPVLTGGRIELYRLTLAEREAIENALDHWEGALADAEKACPGYGLHWTWYDAFGPNPFDYGDDHRAVLEAWEVVRDHPETSCDTTDTVIRRKADGALALISDEAGGPGWRVERIRGDR